MNGFGDRWYHRLPVVGLWLIRRRTAEIIRRGKAENRNPFGVISATEEYIERLDRELAAKRAGL